MTTKKHLAFFAFLGLTFISAQAVAEDTLILKRPIMTLDAAEKIARTAIDTCRKKGINIGVTVVDRSGQTLVVMRDTLAMPLTLDISQQKAYSALSFNTTTASLEGRFKGPGSVAKVDGVITSAGGIPITAAGNILGGIGVSGAPSGKTDEECAKAGLKSVSTDLEMSM
jgi:uncharacterized protein GlcG (DUF336 family)